MKQDMIVILDLGSTQNTYRAGGPSSTHSTGSTGGAGRAGDTLGASGAGGAIRPRNALGPGGPGNAHDGRTSGGTAELRAAGLGTGRLGWAASRAAAQIGHRPLSQTLLPFRGIISFHRLSFDDAWFCGRATVHPMRPVGRLRPFTPSLFSGIIEKNAALPGAQTEKERPN